LRRPEAAITPDRRRMSLSSYFNAKSAKNAKNAKSAKRSALQLAR
jgi:hypothetical protein